MCKKVDITNEDMDYMTIGMCLDFIDEYIDQNKPENEKTRQATQDDMDNF